MLKKIASVLVQSELDEVTCLIEQAEWQDGRASAGENAQKVKTNREMVQNSAAWRDINALVVPRLYRNPVFQRAVLPSRVSAAYVSHYTTGMHYGRHVDDPVMGSEGGRYRADVAVTLFLNSPQSYDGGELKVHTRFGAQLIKMEAGAAVVYPASSLHEVKEVTRGERFVCVLWAQSLVRDVEQRDVLADLDDAQRALAQSPAATGEAQSSIERAYANLVRRWADV